MNYVNFLKQINNIECGNWKALVSRDRDMALITVDKTPAINVIKDDKGKIHCSLHSLIGIEIESLDLISEFVKGNDQLGVNEETAYIAEELGMIKRFDDAGELMINFIKESLKELANED